MEKQFYEYCAQGCLEDAQMLYLKNPQINLLYNGWSSFIKACVGGHLEVAKWVLPLLANLKIQKNMVTAYKNEAYVFACEGGHLHVAKWLKEILNIEFSTPMQLCAFHYAYNISTHVQLCAFHYACNKNRINIVNWICNLDPSLWYYEVEDGQIVKNYHMVKTHEFNKLMLCLDATGYLSIINTGLIIDIYDFLFPYDETVYENYLD